MARHLPSEPRVQAVVDRLVGMFLRVASVNSMADLLSSAVDASMPRIYPNRVHGLLSDDRARSINTSTLEALEQALDRLEAAPYGGEPTPEANRVARAIAALAMPGTAEATDAVRHVAAELGLPAAVVRQVAATSGIGSGAEGRLAPGPTGAPDWSWQDEAVASSLRELRRAPGRKVGLVIPTGGGKTRVALRVALAWLAAAPKDALVVWVTHRRQLRAQARRALQQLLGEQAHLPEGAAALFADRVVFAMVGAVEEALTTYGTRIGLVVVDEAHHAAAPSYAPLFEEGGPAGLFLTATPNRADKAPIGIDAIAYTTSYNELFKRGCVVEPTFDPPLELHDLDWSSPEGLRPLADELIDRTEADFGKTLVVVTQRTKAELLYEALTTVLFERSGHPLGADDIGFVHGDGNSGGVLSPSDFLDEFSARPLGILVATAQLVGEGFDDPSIDAVVVTYPSESMAHLMQVAGRALRAAPGKRAAHLVQVRESALQYHFEQRWLYQDISDELRPELVELSYRSLEDLRESVTVLLDRHRVPWAFRRRVLAELESVSRGEQVRLLFTGVPYYGAGEFAAEAEWNAILVTDAERKQFTEVFNRLSSRKEDVHDSTAFLRGWLTPDRSPGSQWKSYVDLIAACGFARREVNGLAYSGDHNRGFKCGGSTTWLRYITIVFQAAVPDEFDRFLADAINRDSIIDRYLDGPEEWAGVVRLELPLSGSEAFLLTPSQLEWLRVERTALLETLRHAAPSRSFDEVGLWRAGLGETPLPLRVVDNFGQLLRPERLTTAMIELPN
jgi:hypothetical protein